MADMVERVEVPRCQAQVLKRDTYRRTGRTKSGFKMHYTEAQCERRAVHDGRCRQHADKQRFWIEANYYRFM